jgi:DNA-directed RNA polymerase subunit K/omega
MHPLDIALKEIAEGKVALTSVEAEAEEAAKPEKKKKKAT